MKKHTGIKLLIAGVFVMIICLAVTCHIEAREVRTYDLKGLSFQSDLDLSQPEKIGLEAYSMHYPEDVSMGKEQLRIILVFMDCEMMQAFENDDQEIFNYVKGVFLGLITQPEKELQQQTLGKTINGESYQQKNPRKTLEVYLIPRKDDSRVIVAFMWREETESKTAENVISTFFETLTEDN
jgi:hypothetical protein